MPGTSLFLSLLVATVPAQEDDYLERLRTLQAKVERSEQTAQQLCEARQAEASEAWGIVEVLADSGRPEGLEALAEFVDRYMTPLVVEGVPVDCPVESLSMARALHGSTNFLSVRTAPPGAMVTVDGLSMGRTPFVSNRLPEGKHMVRIELEGYRAETRLVEIQAGEIVELHDIPLQLGE